MFYLVEFIISKEMNSNNDFLTIRSSVGAGSFTKQSLEGGSWKATGRRIIVRSCSTVTSFEFECGVVRFVFVWKSRFLSISIFFLHKQNLLTFDYSAWFLLGSGLAVVLGRHIRLVSWIASRFIFVASSIYYFWLHRKPWALMDAFICQRLKVRKELKRFVSFIRISLHVAHSKLVRER